MLVSNDNELGAAVLSAPYDYLEHEDSAAYIEPTFMRQRLDWPPYEFTAPIFDGGCEEGDLTTGAAVKVLPDDEPLFRQGGCHSQCSSRRVYYRQDSSGTETNVSLLENSPDLSEMDTDSQHPCCHRCEILRRQASLQSCNDVPGGGFPDVPVNTDAIITGVDDAFYQPVHGIHSTPSWTDEEPVIKEEFPSLRQSTSNCRNKRCDRFGGQRHGQRHLGAESAWIRGCYEHNSLSASSPPAVESYRRLMNIHPEVHVVPSKPPSLEAVVQIPSRKLTPEKNMIRKAKVARYLEKRKRRTWGHKIRYASRKAYAENRPRIKGRFAKQEEVDALKRKQSLMTRTA